MSTQNILRKGLTVRTNEIGIYGKELFQVDFESSVTKYKVPEGQAGFLIKLSSEKRIVIDPFMSDCVRRLEPDKGFGYKRLMAPVCLPEELKPDILLISHEHPDHYDIDAIDQIVTSDTRVFTNGIVARSMIDRGFSARQVNILNKGSRIKFNDFTLRAVDCDHGALTPDALGFILDFVFGRLYFSGDTAFNPRRLRLPVSEHPEVAILPINGAFGNMNGIEAARYAGLLKCKICIPCHFWTFPLHHGDPQQIIDHIGSEAPDCRLVMLRQGEPYLMGDERK